MLTRFKSRWRLLVLCLVLFAVAFAVYWVTGEGYPNWYNYYVRLADAFLHGRLYVLDNPSWLNELVPNPSGPGYYMVYPPLPAVLLMPLVALFGLNFNQTIFSVFMGSLTVVLSYFVAKDVIRSPESAENRKNTVYLWFAAMFGFGTIFWWLSSNGSVWLTAQVVSVFFLLLAIHEAFGKARPLIMGLLVGASFLCRLPTILGVFFFAGLVISRQPNLDFVAKLRSSLKPLTLLACGVGIFVAVDVIYNYARFKAFFDVAYWMIPGVLNEPWFTHGHFSLLYIPDNLAPFLAGLPTFNLTSPFMHAPIQGVAIWFTTPAFIFALRSKIRSAVTWSAWAAVFSIAFVIFTNAASGWGFGYRYAVDFYPFLFVLAVRGMGVNLRWYHKLLIVLGILVNLWGTIAFNRF